MNMQKSLRPRAANATRKRWDSSPGIVAFGLTTEELSEIDEAQDQIAALRSVYLRRP